MTILSTLPAWISACLILSLALGLIATMGFFNDNRFKVDGKTILITGGSQGMGRSIGRLLAEKGASVFIVARTESKLKEARNYISQGARNPEIQRFGYISADLTKSTECTRAVNECTQQLNGEPPSIVWCCAGTSIPTLFVDSTPESFSDQMFSNYLSSAWIAQAAVKAWLSTSSQMHSPPNKKPTYHLIFTSSLLALYTVAGYSPYSPAKCALRSLADTLSQELQLYKNTADMHVHTVFPATIFTEAYEAENRIKSDMTKMLEAGDDGQTADACAAAAIAELETGRELVPTAFLTRLLICSVLGGSRRVGGLAGFLDGLLGFIMVLVTPWVRWYHDLQVRTWADTHGPSGAKKL